MPKNLVNKIVIPAAGYGTRCLPLSKVVAKELLPLIDKPVIEQIVREAVRSDIKTVILVISPEKQAIRKYFTADLALEKTLKAKGKNELLKTLKAIEHLANFVFAIQDKPLGNGHAVLVAEKAVGDEPFAVAWADDIFVAEPPAISQIKKTFTHLKQSVICLVKPPKGQFETYCSRYGCAKVEPKGMGAFKIKGVIEKPSPAQAPSDLFSIGYYIFTPEIFKYLKKTKPGKGDEIWLADAINTMARDGKIYGQEVKGTYYDLGNPIDLLKASIALALRRPDLKDEFRKYLKEQGVGGSV